MIDAGSRRRAQRIARFRAARRPWRSFHDCTSARRCSLPGASGHVLHMDATGMDGVFAPPTRPFFAHATQPEQTNRPRQGNLGRTLAASNRQCLPCLLAISLPCVQAITRRMIVMLVAPRLVPALRLRALTEYNKVDTREREGKAGPNPGPPCLALRLDHHLKEWR